MFVCAHGDVTEFCLEHDMVVIETHEGNIEDYRGFMCPILVTDQDMSENEYHFLKGKMLARGVELVSTHYKDSGCLADFVKYSAARDAEERKARYGGRHMFGFGSDGLRPDGRAVVKRILELRDAGYVYRQIKADPGVHHPDGRSLSISTIQIIIKNREIYEREGL